MVRTITEIKGTMTAKFIANETIKSIYGLDTTKTFEEQFADVSVESILFYIVAFCVWTLEKLFDLHATQVSKELAQLKPHTARWYRNKALAFLFGYDLKTDSDEFDTEDATDEQIAAAKIVKYAAVVESGDESRLIVKIATEQGNKLAPVSDEQLTAFKAYLAEIKDAGVRTTVINYLPDRLKLNLRIVRDVLVLDANGMDRTTATYPVNDAIQAFMKELPFNGELSLQSLVDKIQEVKGVKDLKLDSAQTSWIDANSGDYGDFEGIDISHIPASGYFAVNLDEDNETKSVIDYE